MASNMSEDRNVPGEEEKKSIIERYENMLAHNESYFFDVDQFEVIIDHYMERSKLQKALDALSYANEMYPDSTSLLLREGQIMVSSGRLSQAIAKLKILLQFEPQNEEGLLTLASVYSQIRDHKNAIRLLYQALDFCDDELKDDIHIDLALEHENLGQWNKAIEVLKNALLRNPENETAIYELAYCFDETNQLAACVNYFNAFINEYPYSFPAWYNLGNVYQRLDDIDKSISAYDFSIAINDVFTPAYLNKASAYVKSENYLKAIETYKEIIAFEPAHAATYCFIGECYERMELTTKASEYYQMAIETDAFFADAYIGLGMVKDLENELEASIAYIQKAIDLEPDQIDYYLLHSAALKKADRFMEAQRTLEKAMILSNDNTEVWIEYADIYDKIESSEKALLTIDHALELNSESLSLHYRRAAYLFKCGKKEAALSLFEHLFAQDFEKCQSLLDDFPELQNDPDFTLLYNDNKP